MKRRSRRARTEELLHVLLWGCQKLLIPTYHNLEESFEEWAYRTGFQRQLADLEAQELLERLRSPVDKRLCRLTMKGRLHVLGGRDPEVCWNTPWDGCWRTVMFDVPVGRRNLRDDFRKLLRAQGFGRMQGSVWVTPHPLDPRIIRARRGQARIRSLILMEGRPCGGERPQDIVREAWNFERINDLYEDYLNLVQLQPTKRLNNEDSALRLRLWAEDERKAWLEAVSADPLLPSSLLPGGYRGVKAWKARQRVLSRIGRLRETFDLA